MGKLKWASKIKNMEICGTSTCPLEALPDDTPEETIEWTREECPCNSEEYIENSKFSPHFARAMELRNEINAGLPPHPDLYHPLWRKAVYVLGREIDAWKDEKTEKDTE